MQISANFLNEAIEQKVLWMLDINGILFPNL